MTWLLYSAPRSPFVRKVMIAAQELDLASCITRHDVATTPMTPAPEVLDVNPLGMIPTLVADGAVIFDSTVILQFFETVSGRLLFGADANRIACLTRHAMINGATDKAVRLLDEQFRHLNHDTRSHVAGHIQAIGRTLDWATLQLAPLRFDAGDIALAALLAYLDLRFPHLLWRDGRPALARWFDRIGERASMQATTFRDSPFV